MAVTGGALSLLATTAPPVPLDEPSVALRLAAEEPDSGTERDDGDTDGDDRDGAARRRPSLEPVRPEPGRFDADELVESVRRAAGAADRAARRRADDEERERRDRAEKAAEQARKAVRGGCAGLPTGGLGAVKPHVREAAGFFGCRFGKPTMLGVAGRGGPSDHPGGLAIDFMIDRATGDALAQCALNNMRALGVKYVIWRQRINYGSGWKPMSDRGGATANHFDHVHISFERGAGGDGPRGC